MKKRIDSAKYSQRLMKVTLSAVLLFASFHQTAFGDYGLIATQQPYIGIIDFTDNQVVGKIETGGKTRSVTFNPDGDLAYVASSTKVIMVSLKTRSVVKTIDLHQRVLAMKTDQKGNRLIVLTNKKASKIFVLSPNSLRIKKRVSINAKANDLLALDFSGSKAAITTGRRQELQIVYLSGKSYRPKNNRIQGITGMGFEDDKKLWLATKTRPKVLRAFDVYRKRIVSQIKTNQQVIGKMTIDPFRHRAVVGAGKSNISPTVVNLTKKTAARLPADPGVSLGSFSFDRFYIYVLDQQHKQLTVIASDKNEKAETINLPKNWKPSEIAVQRVPAKQQGSQKPDYLLGSRHPNTLLGGDGNDTINGFRGNDTIEGGPGDDQILGGTDSDTIDGGDGNDTINEESGSGKISGGEGDDTIDGGIGGETIDGGNGNDTIEGGEHDDTLYGGTGNDRIVEKGLGNEPLIDGGDGDDYIDSGLGKDYKVLGGNGNDTILGRSGVELIQGGDGDDKIDGGTGSDTLEGQAGNDEIRGSQDNDTISAGTGNNTVDGGSGGDKINSEDGNDIITGGPGRDAINSGAGNDIVRVADKDTPFDPKATRLITALSNPLPVDTPFDTVDCGPGYDVVYTENTLATATNLKDDFINCEEIIQTDPEPSTDEPINQTTIVGTDSGDVIPGTAESDILLGGDGDDQVQGNDGDDYVDGENDNDQISGGAGDDQVQGRYGNDQVDGGEGNDYLVGGYGNDSLIGGPGNDILNSGDDPDTINAGPGQDTIFAVNAKKDTVTCGPDKDIVFADLADSIDKTSCEIVRY